MKHLVFSLVILFSSLTFGSVDSIRVDRFAETLKTAESFYKTGELDYFQIAIEAVITHLSNIADSPQRELDIESANQLVEAAEGGIDSVVYERFKLKIESL